MNLNFIPLKFSWCAINPNPKGVVYFIGGAFWGTFPTVFYRFFLKQLFLQGFTIIVFPFRFSFRHWSVSLQLLESQNIAYLEMVSEARRLGYDTDIYQFQDDHKLGEYWLGHSLGCKYIALLELLTDYEDCLKRNGLRQCIEKSQDEFIQKQTKMYSLETISLRNQPSILLDPVISDLDNAVPLPMPLLNSTIGKIIKVLPSRAETFCLIKYSQLFKITSLISFNSCTARESIQKLEVELAGRTLNTVSVNVENRLLGKHLAILGINQGSYSIVKAALNAINIQTIRLLDLRKK